MELNKEKWSKSDEEEFLDYMITFSKGAEKGEWEKRVVNTQMRCIAVQSPDISRITKEIAKGNFISFIDLWMWNNFSVVSIIGSLICKIKDLDLQFKYLKVYLSKIDNWAHCDLLKLQINDKNKPNYLELAKSLVTSEKIFERRFAVTVLFKFLDNNLYNKDIYNIVVSLFNEQEYYVNMALAWLIAECVTKQREFGLSFFYENCLNKFVNNKAISKCRDSFRISSSDKEMLKELRK